jgi:replicative DNA helicase
MNERLIEAGSERALLAGVFNHGHKAFVEINEIVNAGSFNADVTNQILWKCFQHFYDNTSDPEAKPDIASIYASAKAIGHGGHFDKAEEQKYLRSLSNYPIHFDSLRRLAVRLRKFQVARELNAELSLAQEELNSITGDESLHKMLSVVESRILDFGIKLATDGEEVSSIIGEGIDEYLQNIFDNPKQCVGISSGYPLYDKCIGGGLRRGSVNIIGARPKIGKTTVGINIGLHVASLGIPVLYCDMEMDKEDFWAKMLANLANVEISKIEEGRLDAAERKRLVIAKETIKSLPFYYVNIAGKSFEETIAIVKRLVLKKIGRNTDGQIKDCLMIYDYFRLNNIESISNDIKEYQALGFQIIALKIFAKRMDIPILSFIQLNRDGINKEDAGVASGSDRIIWLCNNFTIFKKKTEEENADDIANNRRVALRKLVPIVARHGEGLSEGDYINIFFDGKFARVKEGKTKSQYNKQPKNDGFVMEKDDDTIRFE